MNKALWNDRVQGHMGSAFYNVPAFLEGACSLKGPELEILEGLENKKLLHLQCHFGQDTLSLQRRGAICTGLDFSEKAIEAARNLNQQLGLRAEFVCEEVYKAYEAVGGDFDIVFTSYGTLGWLPAIGPWARQVASCLKPGGELVYVDFHPFVWTLNGSGTEFAFDYFNRAAIVELSGQSYAGTEQVKTQTEVGWNHPFSELLQALIEAGLQVEQIKEWDYSPYPCFENLEERASGEWVWPQHGNRFPMLLGIKARKPL